MFFCSYAAEHFRERNKWSTLLYSKRNRFLLPTTTSSFFLAFSFIVAFIVYKCQQYILVLLCRGQRDVIFSRLLAILGNETSKARYKELETNSVALIRIKQPWGGKKWVVFRVSIQKHVRWKTGNLKKKIVNQFVELILLMGFGLKFC